MKLSEVYDLESIGNRSEQMVHEAIEELVEEGTALCTCQECVLDLVAWTLNHVTPQYYTSLLAPLNPDPARERKLRLEVDLAIASGLKKLKAHPHHEQFLQQTL
jgi:competence protein ComFB